MMMCVRKMMSVGLRTTGVARRVYVLVKLDKRVGRVSLSHMAKTEGSKADDFGSAIASRVVSVAASSKVCSVMVIVLEPPLIAAPCTLLLPVAAVLPFRLPFAFLFKLNAVVLALVAVVLPDDSRMSWKRFLSTIVSALDKCESITGLKTSIVRRKLNLRLRFTLIENINKRSLLAVFCSKSHVPNVDKLLNKLGPYATRTCC